MKDRLSPRHLTQAQRSTITQRLKNAPKADVEMMCAMTSGDNACDFAEEIGAAVRDAGWNVRETTIAAYSPVPVGIEVVQRNKGMAIPPAQAIIQALIAVGLPAIPLADSEQTLEATEVRIFVGRKQ